MMKIKTLFSESLSLRLLSRSFLTALAVALLFGLLYSLYLLHGTHQEIRRDGGSFLQMFAAPAGSALMAADEQRAAQIVDGLLGHAAVHRGSILMASQEKLAEAQRPLQQTALRALTDRLLGREQHFSLMLGAGETTRGRLEVVLDTASYGRRLVLDAAGVLLASLLFVLVLAVALHFVLRVMLTRPLAEILQNIMAINPDRPSQSKLEPVRGHEHNELGVWVKKTNQLFASIDRNNQLRSEAETSLVRLSRIDYLTGLPNRQELQVQLEQILSQSRETVAVMCIGLDGFKTINERYTYQTGDWLLNAFAERIACHFSDEIKLFARLGGDQFIILQDNVEHPYQAATLAQKILQALELPFLLVPSQETGEVRMRLGATIGITLYPDDAADAETLLQKAEQTMVLAKSGQRNRYQFYIAYIDREMRKRRKLEVDLNEAVNQNQLHVLYQPQISYETGEIFGMEALLRWRHPEYGWIAPDVFIPIAEQSGSIIPIGEWVLEQVCRQLSIWLQDSSMQTCRIAVNLSAVQLHHASMAMRVSALLKNHRLPAGCLEVEVTETSLMQDVHTARRNLQALRRIGVSIAIDDFGTGYSSLGYLKNMPLDKIKIDRSFVQDALTSEEDATIVRTIVQLGHSLGLKVLAEGIENRDMEELVISMGCDQGQGFYYSKPENSEAVYQLIKGCALAR